MTENHFWFEDVELQTQLIFSELETSFNASGSSQVVNSNTGNSELVAYIESKRIVVTPNCKKVTVIGCEAIVQEIIKCFIVKNGELSDDDFQKPSDSAGINGFILAGLPGTGKSTILKAVASLAAKLLKKSVSFFNVSSSLLKSKYHGESGKLVDILYEIADKFAPTILLIDEIDGMCGKRKDDEDQHSREFKNQLLSAMNGIIPHPRIITCGATNKPDSLDSAFVRRFDLKYILRLPNSGQRVAMIRHSILSETGRTVEQHGIKDFDERLLSKLTYGSMKPLYNILFSILKRFTGQNITQAVKLASAKTVGFVYKEKLISNEEFEARREEIETNKEPLSGIKGDLTMVLTKFGIERVFPSYDHKEERKIEDWADENCDNADDAYAVEDPDVDSCTGWFCCTHIPFLCCCNRC